MGSSESLPKGIIRVSAATSGSSTQARNIQARNIQGSSTQARNIHVYWPFVKSTVILELLSPAPLDNTYPYIIYLDIKVKPV